jgi:hypothetical protein
MCARKSRVFRRWLSKLTGLTSLCLVFCGASQAQSYYVNCTTGSDSNPGTLSQPFKTLQKAQTAMRHSGTKETTVESCSYSIAGGAWKFGSSDNGETWVPYAGADVVIDGGGSGYITLTSVSNFTFEGFTLQHMPGGSSRDGDMIATGGSGYTLRWNTFLSCNGFCISINGASSSLVDSNTINGQGPATFGGVPGTSYAALSFGPGSSNRVSHNLIENCQGGGIAFRRGPSDPVINNATIDRNLIENVTTGGSESFYHDFGAIYLYDGGTAQSTGLTVTNNDIFGGEGPNYLTDQIKSIYLDASVSGVLVQGNICNKCGEWAVQINGGKSNIVTNNIFDLSQSVALLDLYQNFNGATNMSGNTWTNNIVWTSESFPGRLRNEFGGPGNPPAVSTNDYWPTIPAHCPGCTPAFTDTNPKNCDPGFVDPASNNYTVTSTSCTAQIGWKALPTDQGPLPNPF